MAPECWRRSDDEDYRLQSTMFARRMLRDCRSGTGFAALALAFPDRGVDIFYTASFECVHLSRVLAGKGSRVLRSQDCGGRLSLIIR